MSVVSKRLLGRDSIEDAALARRRRDLVDWLIDEWGQESFPASDPPGGLPPSLMPDRRLDRASDGPRAPVSR